MTDEEHEILKEILAELKAIRTAINENTKSTYDAIRYFNP